jgi:hypothetical protein
VKIQKLKYYRLLAFAIIIIPVSYSAFSHPYYSEKINFLFTALSNHNPFQTKSDEATFLPDFNPIDRELVIPCSIPGTMSNLPVPGIKVNYFSSAKNEIGKGLVRSQTFFTNIYLHKISHFYIETDLIFSDKIVVIRGRTLQDEPLLTLRI